MTCEESEKTILYFYGELDGAAKDLARSHISACSSCSAQLAVLAEACRYLKEARMEPGLSLTEKTLELALNARPRGFFEVLAFDWRQTIEAVAFTVIVAAGFASMENKNAVWKSDIENRLDAMEYGIYQLQSDNTSMWQADFNHRYSDLESGITNEANWQANLTNSGEEV
ncbi:MAG TPA: hypothetical protein DCL44_06670 [Elusimicrobia bacterium]|nr:hypothetical protein [Elusimicrobiota bacterium]